MRRTPRPQSRLRRFPIGSAEVVPPLEPNVAGDEGAGVAGGGDGAFLDNVGWTEIDRERQAPRAVRANGPRLPSADHLDALVRTEERSGDDRLGARSGERQPLRRSVAYVQKFRGARG